MGTWKDFNNGSFGGAMEWNNKLLSHINANRTDKVISYLLSYLDYNDPVKFAEDYKEANKRDEDYQVEFEAVDYLKKLGYRLGIRYLVKHNSKEMCIFEVENDQSRYWHSNFYKNESKIRESV